MLPSVELDDLPVVVKFILQSVGDNDAFEVRCINITKCAIEIKKKPIRSVIRSVLSSDPILVFWRPPTQRHSWEVKNYDATAATTPQILPIKLTKTRRSETPFTCFFYFCTSISRSRQIYDVKWLFLKFLQRTWTHSRNFKFWYLALALRPHL